MSYVVGEYINSFFSFGEIRSEMTSPIGERKKVTKRIRIFSEFRPMRIYSLRMLSYFILLTVLCFANYDTITF